MDELAAIDVAADDLAAEAMVLQHLGGGPAPAVAKDFMHDGELARVHEAWSHSSGKLRYYVQCPNRMHGRCFKYSQADKFASEEDVFAFLAAWCKLGHLGGDKLVHKHAVPSEEQIAAARLAL